MKIKYFQNHNISALQAVHAFTLIEIAIVLLIIGSSVGSVLVGKDIIRSSELRKLTTDFQHYQQAVVIFENKYRSLPGDMKTATFHWGSVGGNGSNHDCMIIASHDEKTCNGNSDGAIGLGRLPSGMSRKEAIRHQSETTRFWQHLGNADLISGNYTGKSFATLFGSAFMPIPKENNSPNSGISDTYWMTQHAGNSTGSTVHFANTDNSHYLYLVSSDTDPSFILVPDHAKILTPLEAFNIDDKIDNGLPNQGRVRSNKTNCTTTSGMNPNQDHNSRYDIDKPDASYVCSLEFYY